MDNTKIMFIVIILVLLGVVGYFVFAPEKSATEQFQDAGEKAAEELSDGAKNLGDSIERAVEGESSN